MYYFEEVKSNLPDLHEPELFHACIEEIRQLLQCIKQHYTNRDSANFALGLFAKYIYSCLIDADRLDAYLFESRKPYAPASIDWKTLTSRFEQEIAKKPKNDPINQIRAEISEKCKHAGGRDTGIYRLSLPTGSGKTLSSFRFALHHALKTGKKRIIYVIPYLSITTQTAGELRDILKLEKDSDLLLEHYSSVAAPETEEENEKRKLATARWDNPIIVTTMVQFLETVMSAKGSDLRKFHHMQDSVIIFDEIQSLPINCVHLFNEIVSFLSKILHTTVLLCTATQPTIDKTFRHNLLLSEQPDLIPDYQKYHEMLRRTRIVACSDEKTIDELASIVYEKAVKNRNCLCIVNLKSQAQRNLSNHQSAGRGKDLSNHPPEHLHVR